MTNYINNKTKELTHLYERLNNIKYTINQFYLENEYPSDGADEMYLDELYLDVDLYKEKIEKLEKFLYATKQLTKYKYDLINNSNKILYNPSRVTRLLEEGMISFTEPNSFDDL